MDGILRESPIGIRTLVEVRKENYPYVDKTAFMWQIVNVGKPYFLSRPRHFGKSLLSSTFEAYFEGKKESSKGLAIADMEKEWGKYPVLRLDLSAKKYGNSDNLLAILNQHLEKRETVYGDEKRGWSPEERFDYIIRRTSEQCGYGVVVLVDEYDKPLL